MPDEENKSTNAETLVSPLNGVEKAFKASVGQFNISNAGLMASVATLTMAAVAIGAYVSYNKIKEAMDKAQYRLPKGELLKAYQKMVELFEEHIRRHLHGEGLLETPKPAFWQLREGSDDLLTHRISREEIIEAYRNTRQPFTPETVHFYHLSNEIVSKLIDSLRYEEEKFFIVKDNQRHPYVLFVLEFVHWARTELLTYSANSHWVLDRLEKRLRYMRACLEKGGELIPIKDKQFSRQTAPYSTVEAIGVTLETLISNLTSGRQYLEFKDAIYDMSATMGAVVTASLNAQIKMVIKRTKSARAMPSALGSREDPDRDDKLVHFSVRDIRESSSDEIKPYAQTIIFKRLRAFCDALNLDSFSLLTCEEMPEFSESCVDELSELLEAIDADFFRETTEEGKVCEYSASRTGLDDATFEVKNKVSLLGAHKAHLKELAKWLILKDTVAKFAKLHEFKGTEWAFGSAAGVKLLKELMALVEIGITTLNGSAKNSSGSARVLFQDGFGAIAREALRKQENQRGVMGRRCTNVLELFEDMEKGFKAIKKKRQAIYGLMDSFSETQRQMQQIEAKIYRNLGLLSRLYQQPQEHFQELASAVESSTVVAPEIAPLDTVAHLYAVNPYNTARQVRLSAQLLKVLALPAGTAIPFSLQECDDMLKKKTTSAHCVLAKSMKLTLLRAGADIMVAAEAKHAHTFLPFVMFATGRQKVTALAFTFKLIAFFANYDPDELKELVLPTEYTQVPDFIAQLDQDPLPQLTLEQPWVLSNEHTKFHSPYRAMVRATRKIRTSSNRVGSVSQQLLNDKKSRKDLCSRILDICLLCYGSLYEQAMNTLREFIQSAKSPALSDKEAELDVRDSQLRAREAAAAVREQELSEMWEKSQEAITSYLTQQDELRVQRDMLGSKQVALQTEQEKLTQDREAFEAKKNEVNHAERQQSDVQTSLAKARNELSVAAFRIDTLESRVTHLKETNQQLKAAKTALEQDNTALKASGKAHVEIAGRNEELKVENSTLKVNLEALKEQLGFQMQVHPCPSSGPGQLREAEDGHIEDDESSHFWDTCKAVFMPKPDEEDGISGKKHVTTVYPPTA